MHLPVLAIALVGDFGARLGLEHPARLPIKRIIGLFRLEAAGVG